MRDAGRTQREFPSANQGLGNGDGKENIRRSDVVVVEEIRDVGLEVIGVEYPSAVRDGNAELMFFVALAGQRDETQLLSLDITDQGRSGNGLDRRRLIVMSIEGAECPPKLGDGDSGAEARADGGLVTVGGAEPAAKLPSENRVGRMPAESVSQEKGLNLSSM